ncbi:hypothetical protein [Niastella populi]|uniref:Uncharacterized protein n=1 Tax=Niastella populi TaxID=550983 RepID=A0A1V9FVG8_9BACT|nr:hypothetical protein [Niastella populi]OQP62246.1 hypothetical protein A4R26_18405 [Niastella populi]
MENKNKTAGKDQQTTPLPDKNKQGVDKAPGGDKPVEGKLTEPDLKGKKVDRDSGDPKDEPMEDTDQ